ncbi:hypothetical protein FB567DRAFT_430335 [Paraphoma chrysanthemicola]|uniref:C2H2-type domain-containing protein n=1 Tax=Paraphoma chrysanthemicola TaxID=798071 RepID=A0A8K0RIS7_9PLEO|nr:hypothetical protein FB567DRAFT_430335 [Paraphoma chrysanthemicola]
MSSKDYNPYTYPYPQSTAQQYPTYQTAPTSNNAAQPSRQYQQPSTSQADYMEYQGQSYGGQGSGYATSQNHWNGSSYAGNRETTSRAAEVLRNMSSNNYTPTATSQAGATATNTATSQSARYSPRMQPQQTHAYGQSQNRPHMVMYNQQQQRSESPAQPQHHYSTPSGPSRNTAPAASAAQQYPDYDRRQLASVEASRTQTQSVPPASYNSDHTPTVVPPGPIAPPQSTVSDTYTGQGSTTVDPMAVYDPWPEYQRKQEALRAQKAIEGAVRADEERIAEEGQKAEEAKKEDERKRQEALAAASQPKAKKRQQSAAEPPVPAATPTNPEEALEAEIRAMMAKMRELNSKDPALLARIWEEERRAKASPKSPTVPNRSTEQPGSVASASVAQASTPQVANQRKKAVPKEAMSTSVTKPATPVPASAAPMRAQAQPSSVRQGGNTIWPPEKKAQLASAAAEYLRSQNPGNPVDSARILTMLDGNPSYIELCEQLERMGLKLDRAAFAKNLLTAVPDVNSTTRKTAPQPVPIQRPQIPPAVMKKEISTPAAASPGFVSAASPAIRSSQPPFPDSASPAATPVIVAEMVPIKPELKLPANKEEAARKRNLSDLVDITLLSDEEDMRPPPKRHNADAMCSYGSPHPHIEDAMVVDSEPVVKNFPIANIPSRQISEPTPQPVPLPDRVIRERGIVEPLDKKKALRRNNYNPATIARDVLLACGRHPSERQLNQHLDVLRSNLPHIGFDSDLSTIKWDILDPGKPPPGYFKDSVQALTQDADDEDDSEDENRQARPRATSNAIGGDSGAPRVQALPEAINPFKQKKRGRPPRHSLPNDPAAGVGYKAFRPAEIGPDGKPLPKKKGRPVGWRKAIHGSAAAQARPAANGFTGPLKHQPSQPSGLRNVKVGEPIRIDSRSPSVVNRAPRFQPYKCKWQNCIAELHNLETLKKHVFKVHQKRTLRNMLECLWEECGKEVTNFDPNTNMRIEKHTPSSFTHEDNWREHLERSHFAPLSWELGDGPASGLSDAHDSEAYLSDTQGRRVTPRITVDRDYDAADAASTSFDHLTTAPRGRGRPAKNAQEREAREAQERLVSQKRRIGGPGMDRGGATLVNDKRRRGLQDSDGTEEELVDVEN